MGHMGIRLMRPGDLQDKAKNLSLSVSDSGQLSPWNLPSIPNMVLLPAVMIYRGSSAVL